MTHPSRNLAFISCHAFSASSIVAYLTKPKPFNLPETLSVTTFASRSLPKGANAPWSFSSLTNSLGVVSGGTLATSASSPNMEDGGGGVCDGPEPEEEEQTVARNTEEAGVELQTRRRSRAEEEAEWAIAGG